MTRTTEATAESKRISEGLGLPLAATPAWVTGLCRARRWVPRDAACQDDETIHSS